MEKCLAKGLEPNCYDSIFNFRSLSELDKLAKPWHYEFWSDIPDDLPFSLVHLNPVIPKLGSSKAASKRYRESQKVASI